MEVVQGGHGEETTQCLKQEGVVAARLEAPEVRACEGVDAASHAVGLVLGEALLDSRDDIFLVGHGLDVHVTVQRVEEGEVAGV